ncbi:hypothetical protein ABZ634_21985, partial [Nocardiopsis alba]
MSVLICVFVVLTVAAMVRIAAGFGFALVAVPPLALLLDPVSAVVVAATLAVPLNLWVMARDRAHVDRRGASLPVGRPRALLHRGCHRAGRRSARTPGRSARRA